MTNEDQWLMRINGALSAHFFQPDGGSRPGTDWSVELKQGERQYQVMVRAYLSEDMTESARADTEYQGQTVLGYVSDLLSGGWRPEQGGELEITIRNPTGEKEGAASKPWWRFW
ncbi:MAG TPA: hypothetical protein VM864_00775 [Pyrinomonadaceae bacterium]|jgi:hypothetical protein|nr:hypothetical protein [Pyrinomonadaceae bacterium]